MYLLEIAVEQQLSRGECMKEKLKMFSELQHFTNSVFEQRGSQSYLKMFWRSINNHNKAMDSLESYTT